MCFLGWLMMRLRRLYGMVGACVGGVVDDRVRVRQCMRECCRSGVSAFVSYVIWCIQGGTYRQSCTVWDAYKSELYGGNNECNEIHTHSIPSHSCAPSYLNVYLNIYSCTAKQVLFTPCFSFVCFSVFAPASSHLVYYWLVNFTFRKQITLRSNNARPIWSKKLGS